MKSKRGTSKGKKINPHFWVFCEGETEEAYIRFLRSEYRLPVEIIPKIAGCDINERYIQSYKKGKPVHKKDIDFLVYDADVHEVLENLKTINDVILIASNPSIELWFLLHYKNQTSEISEDTCIRDISNRNHNSYKKGVIDEHLKVKLRDKCSDACNRSKKLTQYKNPSTNMHAFIEVLRDTRK
jgi:hypothetical protein